MTDKLDAALRSLGTQLDVPDPPDVTGAVMARLDEPRPRPRRLLHRVAAAAVAALVALATAMVVSPTVRAAVYDLLRIGGVEIHENQPPPPIPSLDPPLPGEHDVPLAEARASAGFPLRLPDELGEPVNVRLVDDGRGVSMAFTSAHGVIRLDQFAGELDPVFAKFAAAPEVHHVTVAGVPGVWVDRPHAVLYVDRDGQTHEESARLAGSTLVWESDGVTYRVEGDLTETQATAVAESLR